MTKLILILIENGYSITFKKLDVNNIQVQMVKDSIGQHASIKIVNFNSCVCDLLVVMKNKIDLALKVRNG